MANILARPSNPAAPPTALRIVFLQAFKYAVNLANAGVITKMLQPQRRSVSERSGSLRLSSQNSSSWQPTPNSTSTAAAMETKGGTLSRWLPNISPPPSSGPATSGDGESFRKSDDGGGTRKSPGLGGIGAKLSAFVRAPVIDTSNLFGALGSSSPSPRGKSAAAPPLADYGSNDHGGGADRGIPRKNMQLFKDPAVEASAVVGTEALTPVGFNSSPRAHGRVPATSPSDSHRGGGGGDSRRERMLPFRRPVAHPTSPTTVNAREALGVSSPRARGGSTRRGSGSGIGGAGIGIDCADAARWASGKPLVDVRRGNGASRGAGDRKTLGGGARWGGIKAINTRWNANPQRGPSHHHTTHVPRALASDKFTSNNGVSSVPSRGASSDERSSVGSVRCV